MFKYLSVLAMIVLIGCSECQGCGTKLDAAPEEPDACVDAGTDAGTDGGQEDTEFAALYETVCRATRLKAF